jgi:mutator protein MutT
MMVENSGDPADSGIAREPQKRIEVGLGVIRDQPAGGSAGRVLVTRRPAGTPYAGYWEFPGGKVEPGETPADCVVRELREELGIEVAIEDESEVIEHIYEHAWVRLRPYWCRIVAGSPRAVAVADWRWVGMTELASLAMPEGNAELVRAVRQRLEPNADS